MLVWSAMGREAVEMSCTYKGSQQNEYFFFFFTFYSFKNFCTRAHFYPPHLYGQTMTHMIYFLNFYFKKKSMKPINFSHTWALLGRQDARSVSF